MSRFFQVKLDMELLIECDDMSKPVEILTDMSKKIMKTNGIVDILDWSVGPLRGLREA